MKLAESIIDATDWSTYALFGGSAIRFAVTNTPTET
jgi:hypothetical protein